MTDYEFIVDDNGPCGTLHIKRSCGHIDLLFYGGEEFAQKDIPHLLTSICWSCYNMQKIQQLDIQLALEECKQNNPQ